MRQRQPLSPRFQAHHQSAMAPPRLELYQGNSLEVTPLLSHEITTGQRPHFDVIVHEILGHIASSEGVAIAIRDLHRSGVCSDRWEPGARGTATAHQGGRVLWWNAGGDGSET